MWLNQFRAGFSHVFTALGMLWRPGLRPFLIWPLLINVLLFSLLAWFAGSWFGETMDWLLPQDSWLNFLRWLLWPIFAVIFVLVIFFGFTILGNLIGAPFNGPLAARVEQQLTGTMPRGSGRGVIAEVGVTIGGEISKLGYFLVRAIPVLILFLIPVVNLAAPPLWILLTIWFLALEYFDYPMGNQGMTAKVQRQTLKTKRPYALGFGAGLTLLMLVPPLTLVAMPVGVIAATMLWVQVREQSPEEN